MDINAKLASEFSLRTLVEATVKLIDGEYYPFIAHTERLRAP